VPIADGELALATRARSTKVLKNCNCLDADGCCGCQRLTLSGRAAATAGMVWQNSSAALNASMMAPTALILPAVCMMSLKSFVSDLQQLTAKCNQQS
jgi:hypothetical protein